MTPLLPACYFGPVELYGLLARHPKAIIDAGEHYVRQSHRTRTRIMGPNGAQDLCVPIVHDHGRKMPMHEVRLCHAEPWPQRHLHAIRTAYGKTPWFIHYIGDIEAVLLHRHERLIDLDLATLRLGMAWLGLKTEVAVSTDHVPVAMDERRSAGAPDPARRPPSAARYLDLRSTLHPKRELPPEIAPCGPYPQVFADRHGWRPRMSVIDLMCNCGPDAARFVHFPSGADGSGLMP